jgi:endoglycosylceramidase
MRIRTAATALRGVVMSISIAAVAALPAAAGAVPTLPLGHHGRWITDAQGRVVVTHGTNMVYKLAPYYPVAAGFGNSDAAFLEKIGFTAVRVGVIWEALEPQPGVYDDRYLNEIASTVQTLARHGIVSLLDFHQDNFNEQFKGEGFPAWAVQTDGLPNTKVPFPAGYETNPALQRAFENFWADKPGPGGVGLQQRYAAAWRHVAQRFVGNPNVLGYEIMNEPFPGSDFALCAGPTGCAASDAQLTGLERKVDRAIRTVDPRTLVFYEPYVTFDFGFQDGVGSLDDPRSVFAWHDYCLTGDTCSSNATNFPNAAAHVSASGAGTFLDEFGATANTTGLDTLVTLADQYMVPWMEWSYCTCGDPTGSSDEGIVIDPHKPKTGSNLRSVTLHAIVEPYPYVIAGTPQSWSYDRQTRAFHLTYSTVRASRRGTFPAGSLTDIQTPAFDYPAGYRAQVSGGTIISKAGAPELQIAACPGAKTVTVQTSPGHRSTGTCRLPHVQCDRTGAKRALVVQRVCALGQPDKQQPIAIRGIAADARCDPGKPVLGDPDRVCPSGRYQLPEMSDGMSVDPGVSNDALHPSAGAFHEL